MAPQISSAPGRMIVEEGSLRLAYARGDVWFLADDAAHSFGPELVDGLFADAEAGAAGLWLIHEIEGESTRSLVSAGGLAAMLWHLRAQIGPRKAAFRAAQLTQDVPEVAAVFRDIVLADVVLPIANPRLFTAAAAVKFGQAANAMMATVMLERLRSESVH